VGSSSSNSSSNPTLSLTSLTCAWHDDGDDATGNFATFGYVVEGGKILDDLEKGDTIVDAKIISGKDFLKYTK